MTPKSKAVLDAAKKAVDEALSKVVRDTDKADTFEALEKFSDHIGETDSAAQAHMDSIEESEEE